MKWTYPYVSRVVMALLMVDAKAEVLTHSTGLLSGVCEVDP